MARDPAQREVPTANDEQGSPKSVVRASTRSAAAPDVRTVLRRVVIENVKPQVDGGRFAIKRTPGERVVVVADVFADGHDQIACTLRHRRAGARVWTEARMAALGNDRWRGEYTVTDLGRYEYALAAWIDAFLSWRHDFTRRKVDDEKDIALALRTGATLVDAAAKRASGRDATLLHAMAKALLGGTALSARHELALGEELVALMNAHPDRERETVFEPPLVVVVEPERARYSAWYELFPRSTAKDPKRHGTFADCEAQLPRLAAMGFDILYLPPIHPIGRVKRKGRNNALAAGANDPGSPWAIGAKEGGHKAIHPDLGSLRDFKRLVAKARKLGIEVALDIALQCAPDHPYVKAHPEWFKRRPDGSVQYAENPPKKYEDIYPFNFDTPGWRALWEEVRSIFEYWIEQGVVVFRVDNPHTKPFALWEWVIAEVKRPHPEVIFLSEAFTRPRVMHRLAKLGYSQSYTYFPWRNTKAELTEYFTELSASESREYFRPSTWPNTPDILTEYLQFGGRPAFMTRLVLAATLSACYGIYGPAFELAENVPRQPDSEEYLDSDKYEIKHRDLDRPDSLRDFIARVNAVRRDNRALHFDWNLRFHGVDNDQLICYSKSEDDRSGVVLTVVNLDPHHRQSGWVALKLDELGVEPEENFQAHDLLSGARYIWRGARNYVELDPQICPAHIFRIRRRMHTERDFDYFL
jgi:starch synthase (maltosyl-transferring)